MRLGLYYGLRKLDNCLDSLLLNRKFFGEGLVTLGFERDGEAQRHRILGADQCRSLRARQVALEGFSGNQPVIRRQRTPAPWHSALKAEKSGRATDEIPERLLEFLRRVTTRSQCRNNYADSTIHHE